MIMFDCKFGNVDRNVTNFGLGILNDDSEKIRFYPLFDNESLFYFGLAEKHIKMNEGRFEDVISKHLRSKLYFEYNDNQNPTMIETARLLFRENPEEARKAFEKVKKITRNDLKRALDEFELSKPRRDFTLAVFDYLDKQLNRIYEGERVSGQTNGKTLTNECNGEGAR